MLDVDAFRAIFPEFSDTATFPDAQVVFWLVSALNRLPELVWGGLWGQGVALLTAHHLALAARRSRAMAGGNGGGVGLVSSKSVGGVSIAFDNSAGTLEGAGAYNLTPYGVEFWQLAGLVGVGGTQL